MNRKKGFFYSRGFRIILIVLVLFAAYRFYLNQREVRQIKREIARIEQELKEVERRKKELEEELGHIDDPAYIEKIAREELGLVKPGELLLVPVEEKDDD